MARSDHPSWGLIGQTSFEARPAKEIIEDKKFHNPDGFIAYGNGRSYGDSCHNASGLLALQRPANKVLSFDEENGTIECEPGILLSEILDLIIPKGFFLPVTPGTRFVSLGGAIANDVHGKNHHQSGTFGAYVEELTLWRSDQGKITCSLAQNQEFFAATIGGLGLTGFITKARIKLHKVSSPDVRQKTTKFSCLDDYFKLINAADKEHHYSVAWLDAAQKGQNFGRGVLMSADHDQSGKPPSKIKKSRLNVPFTPPISLLNRLTLKAFNEAYFFKARNGEQIIDWASYFHPLDGIQNWNRLYGPKGLYQHQSVYPLEGADMTTTRLIECAQAHKHSSFLTVIKQFGACPSPGLLSFPKPGITLTLDFSNQGIATHKLLNALDEIVLAAGGRINPYKDARMSAETFAASFPHWQELEKRRDPVMMSDFWRRTAKSLPFCETNTLT